MISIETSNLLFFISASLLLIIAPGPDIVFLVTQSVTRGPRAGFATAMGLAAGNLVHTTAAALGVSVIFRASPVAFQALKLAGVVYLLYLAWRTLHEPEAALKDSDFGTTARGSVEGGSSSPLFWRGFFMNVLNPKVALFFLAFLPQFASPARGAVWAQMIAYGVLFTLLVVLVFGTMGLAAGRIAGWFGEALRTGPVVRASRWIVAGVFLALAVRLAVA